MAVKKQQEEEEEDTTPSWARTILESLTNLTSELNDRVSALESKNVESSTGKTTENTTSTDSPSSGERKPKRGGFLSAWDRD